MRSEGTVASMALARRRLILCVCLRDGKLCDATARTLLRESNTALQPMAVCAACPAVSPELRGDGIRISPRANDRLFALESQIKQTAKAAWRGLPIGTSGDAVCAKPRGVCLVARNLDGDPASCRSRVLRNRCMPGYLPSRIRREVLAHGLGARGAVSCSRGGQ